MRYIYMVQATLRNQIGFKGIGVHSGKKVHCTLHPAPANHGIVFLRSDLPSNPRIKADISKVSSTALSTTLSHQDIHVSTVEHLMAALFGMGVDNALVEVDGPEIPIMDGSSREFVDAIADVGIRELALKKKAMRLKKSVSVRVGDKWMVAKPAKIFSIKGSISFVHEFIGHQHYKYTFSSRENFKNELAGARTFGFLREVQHLHKKGLALGGSLDNAIVLDDQQILNPEGLRYKNEFVRHKVLDAIGDLALLGLTLEAEIETNKAGHELHANFLRKLIEDPTNYEIFETGFTAVKRALPEEKLSPIIVPAY